MIGSTPPASFHFARAMTCSSATLPDSDFSVLSVSKTCACCASVLNETKTRTIALTTSGSVVLSPSLA